VKKRVLLILFSVVFILPCLVHSTDREQLKWLNKKPHIKEIRIEGNTYFSSGEIQSRMYSKEYNFLRRFLKGERRVTLQRESAYRDSLEIMYLYLTNGFIAAKVEERFELANKDSAALVVVTISEGRQFRYGKTTHSGTFEERFRPMFEKNSKELKTGELINPFQLRQAVFDMKTVLANNGYPYAEVSFSLDSTGSEQLTPITFNILSDSLVHFGTALIEGITKYPDYVARRELKIKPGALYRRNDILSSQRRLYESGYFNTLTLRQDEKSHDRFNPGMIIRVRERKPHYITLQTGAAQSAVKDLLWDASIAFGKRNFIGSRKLELSSSYSFSVGKQSRLLLHQYQLQYTEPWLAGIRFPLVLTGEVKPRVKSVTQPYDISSWSVGASTVKKFSDKVSTSAGFEYQSVSISGVSPDEPVVLVQEEGYSNRRKIYSEFREDTRNNIFTPARGTVTDISVQYVGGFLGGDDNFTKWEASFSAYKIIWPGWTWASRIKFGQAKAFGNSGSVPRDDRLFLGGANSVRGFLENSLGPKRDDGYADGANFTVLFNQELRWKTIQIFQVPILKGLLGVFPLWQSVFFDAGNGFGNTSEFRFDALAFSYGTGFQIVTPAGPIRIDYARVIKTDRFSFASRWHFTILYAF
jgi:outer membrane protein insertion porin family